MRRAAKRTRLSLDEDEEAPPDQAERERGSTS